MKECIMTLSRLAFVCGNAGHSALAPGECLFNHHEPVPFDMCEQAFRDGYVARPHTESNWFRQASNQKRLVEKIKVNGTTEFRWAKSGHTWQEGDDHDVYCAGTRWYNKGEYTYRTMNHAMVVMDYVHFSVAYRTAYITEDPTNPKEGKMIIHHNQVLVPADCRLRHGKCIIDGIGTYIWEPLEHLDQCPMYKLRETVGVDVREEGEEEQVTYISHDQSMIRLKKGPAEKWCGATVFPTDHEQLYLTSELRHHAFQRQVPLIEGSAFLYANQKLQFVYETLKAGLEAAVLRLRVNNCKREQVNQVRAYANKAAQQRVVMDRETAHVGEVYFGTAVGEVWWVYACRSIIVTARATPGLCYNALPVMLTKKDMKRILEQQQRKNAVEKAQVTDDQVNQAMNETTGIRYYLEPRTRRLVTIAARVPCLPEFSPLYRNTKGNWIAHHGSLSMAKSPLLLKQAAFDGGNFTLPSYEVDGGVYPGKTITEIEAYVSHARLKDQLLSLMETKARNGGALDKGHEDIWPRLPGTLPEDILGGIKVFGWFWRLVDGYGDACGIIIGTMILCKFLAFLLGIVIRLCSTPQHPNILVHVLGAFFPSITERLTRGQYRPQGAPGPCHEFAQACCRCEDLGTPRRKNSDAFDIGDKETIDRFEHNKKKLRMERMQRVRLMAKRRAYRLHKKGRESLEREKDPADDIMLNDITTTSDLPDYKEDIIKERGAAAL